MSLEQIVLICVAVVAVLLCVLYFLPMGVQIVVRIALSMVPRFVARYWTVVFMPTFFCAGMSVSNSSFEPLLWGLFISSVFALVPPFYIALTKL